MTANQGEEFMNKNTRNLPPLVNSSNSHELKQNMQNVRSALKDGKLVLD